MAVKKKRKVFWVAGTQAKDNKVPAPKSMGEARQPKEKEKKDS